MVEKDLYRPFAKKLEEIKLNYSAVFELKIVKTKRFSFSSVHPHQVEGLLRASQGLYVRLADQPFMEGGFQQKKPFDCMWLKEVTGYVVPVFYVPRKRKQAYLVPIGEFLKFDGKSVKEEQLQKFDNFSL